MKELKDVIGVDDHLPVLQLWNPVKELKVGVMVGPQESEPPLVESGEGIESSEDQLVGRNDIC